VATLYHYPFCPPAHRVRLALAYKGLDPELVAPAYTDVETPVELAGRKELPVYVDDDGTVVADSTAILQHLEARHPDPPLFHGVLDEADWQGLVGRFNELAPLLDRLVAPALLAFPGLADDADAAGYYRRQVEARTGIQIEELVNARYSDFLDLQERAQLRELGGMLAKARFFTGELSAADLLITSELGPLRLSDGIHPPLDLLYYFERVEAACGVAPLADAGG
jgi:glutathione S-transferase